MNKNAFSIIYLIGFVLIILFVFRLLFGLTGAVFMFIFKYWYRLVGAIFVYWIIKKATESEIKEEAKWKKYKEDKTLDIDYKVDDDDNEDDSNS